ncbi:MAG: methyltransferase domain-containing protein [Dermatophilaceae bacterium]
MCGPAGSGKSTHARRLEAAGMVRLSVDVEAWRQGHRSMPIPDAVAAELEEGLRIRLVELVSGGVDVVVDLSFWSRRMRDSYRRLLAPLGVVPEVVHVVTPAPVALDRVRIRADAGADDFRLDEVLAARYHEGFEPPTPDEGPLMVVRGDEAPGGSHDEVRAAYDAIAEEYAATYPSTEPEAAVDLAMVDHVIRLVVEAGGSTVLDAGCGTGRMTRYVADRGLAVTGVDLSPGMLAMARRDHPDLDVREGSLLSLPLDDASFDGVVLWYSLIHLTDTELPVALAEAFRVVRPGGCVLAAFQVGDGPWDVGRGLRDRGHAVALVRHQRGVEPMLDAVAAVGFVEEARLVRAPVGPERHPQAFLLARRPA